MGETPSPIPPSPLPSLKVLGEGFHPEGVSLQRVGSFDKIWVSITEACECLHIFEKAITDVFDVTHEISPHDHSVDVMLLGIRPWCSEKNMCDLFLSRYVDLFWERLNLIISS